MMVSEFCRRPLLHIVFFVILPGCNIQSGKNHYILAERLFADQKYSASVQEFRKVVDSDPKSVLSQQALFRIGMIDHLYLDSYLDAIRSFKQFIILSKNDKLVYEAEKNIGEIYFTKLEDFRSAIDQYKKIIEKYPDSKESDSFYFRRAKSFYNALDFKKANETFGEMIKRFPESEHAPEALYQIGNTYFTQSDCDHAIKVFREVLEKYPNTRQAVFAQFVIGNCFEELEQPDQALAIYNQILDKHPSRNVVEAKIKRLKGRRVKKKS